MAIREIYQCQCGNCQQPKNHPDKQHHHMMNLLLSRLNEQQRRWYVAVEAEKIGHGGTEYMSVVTGINVNTIRKGRQEMANNLVDRPHDRVRIEGGGRKPVEKKIWES
ncbi:MAG: transposase [Chloroflexi bacterium]|nr:transposase [Chloroflexota bacterium]